MSIQVKCTIELSDEVYEAGTQQQEIFKVVQYTSSTGVFSAYPGAFARSLVEAASRMATEEALRKLKAIKGNILFDDEEAVGVLKQSKARAKTRLKRKPTPPTKTLNKEDSDEH